MDIEQVTKSRRQKILWTLLLVHSACGQFVPNFSNHFLPSSALYQKHCLMGAAVD